MQRGQDEHDRKGLSGVFAVGEFRALWTAETGSIIGSQFARVAFAILVFDRTGSAGWAASVYALTFLPALLGGVLLGWVADRYARRGVMIGSDVLRAALMAIMAIPGLPLPVLCVLIVVAVLIGTPHTSAQGALLPEVLTGSLLERGFAVRQMTSQLGQIAGFAGGGLLLASTSPSTALLINAGTFAFSAVIVATGVHRRPRPVQPSGAAAQQTSWLREIREGAEAVFGNAQLRTLAIVAWLAAGYVAPEGVAVVYAGELGFGSGQEDTATGLLMAAIPAGSVLGAFVMARWVPQAWRSRLSIPAAAAAAIPLIATPVSPHLVVTLVLWALSGAFTTACLVQTQADFVRATPAGLRGRATGLAAAGLIAAQGIALLVCGAIADVLTAASAVAICGAVGLLASVALLVGTGGRALTARPTPVAEPAPGPAREPGSAPATPSGKTPGAEG